MSSPFTNIFGNLWGANGSPLNSAPPKSTSAAQAAAQAQVNAAALQARQWQSNVTYTTVSAGHSQAKSIDMQSMIEARKVATSNKRVILSGLSIMGNHRFQISGWWFTFSIVKRPEYVMEVMLVDEANGQSATRILTDFDLKMVHSRMDEIITEVFCDLMTELLVFIQLEDKGGR